MEKSIKKNEKGPIYFCLSLVFGIIAALISIAWIIQLIGTTIYSNKKPLFTFLDTPLVNLQATNGLGFLSVAIYSLMVLYLQGSAVKGNIVFGLRIPFVISFHPMKKDRTYLNSFLFNVNIMMLSSIATTQLAVLAFPNYLAKSYLGYFYQNQVRYLPMFGWLFSFRIFMAALDIIFFIAIAVMIFQTVRASRAEKKKD